MTEEKRKNARANIAFTANLMIGERSIQVNVISMSPKVIRIDPKLENALSQPCMLSIPTQPPTNLECKPIIEEAEATAGSWNRLSVQTTFNLDNTLRLINAAKRNKRR